MSSDDQKILLYVAIDFGTTFSGYAFRFKNTKETVVCTNLGGEALGFKSYKVPTCVLIDNNKSFVAFGYTAQNVFSDDDEDSEDGFVRPLHFYDEFKMMLHGDEAIDKGMLLESYDGFPCPAITIFGMALRHLKLNLLELIKAQNETIPKDDEIKWVLTVPAIWSDSAKQFMRECAVEAGIVKEDSQERLLIALEPEAASLFCRTLNVCDFRVKPDAPNTKLDEGLPRDSHYMVVDCGGGTVDVTAHHYKKGGDICELYAASGGKWGGRNVNIRFEKALDKVLGDDFMDNCKTKYPGAYLQLKTKFEKEKRSIMFEKQKETYNFVCPYFFDSLCKDVFKKSMKSVIEGTQSDIDETHRVEFRVGTLKFPDQVLNNIFGPPIQDIKTHVLDLLSKKELKHIEYIYLVGGFSDCSLLQKIMQAEFTLGSFASRNIQIVLAPYEASLAVVRGAVSFGSNPKAISSRRARRFYCIGKYSSKTSVQTTTKKKMLLVPIVEQNEEIENDDVKHAHFIPCYEGKVFKLYHYKVDKHTAAAKYTTDKVVDEIEINCEKIIGSNCSADTKISVYLYFGSTEIHVTARNDKAPDKKQITQSVNCLKH